MTLLIMLSIIFGFNTTTVYGFASPWRNAVTISTAQFDYNTQHRITPLIYPNPASKKRPLHLYYRLKKPLRSVCINTYDMNGNLINQLIRQSGQSGTLIGKNKIPLHTNIHLTNLASSVYFMLIFDESQSLIGRTAWALLP